MQVPRGIGVILFARPLTRTATSDMVHLHFVATCAALITNPPISCSNQAHATAAAAVRTNRNNVTRRLQDDPQSNPHTL